jgi:hypothetical protein
MFIFLKYKPHSETGASLTEYVITLAILLVVFLVGGLIIERAATTRGDLSMGVGARPVACDTRTPLGAIGGDACK